jgi:hypothetical protein
VGPVSLDMIGKREDMIAYSDLHLYEEIVFGSPLPLREGGRVRGSEEKVYLLSQTKIAIGYGALKKKRTIGLLPSMSACAGRTSC